MSDQIPPPPPGFIVIPPPPPGFTRVDGRENRQPSTMDRVRSIGRDVGTTALDVGKGALTGLARGTEELPGLPGDVVGFAGKGLDALARGVGVPEDVRSLGADVLRKGPMGYIGDVAGAGLDRLARNVLPTPAYDKIKETVGNVRERLPATENYMGVPLPTSQGMLDALARQHGPIPHANTSLGRIVEGAAEQLPTALLPIGGEVGLGMRAAEAGLSGAASEIAGQLTSDNPWAKGIAALAGPTGIRAGAKVITPNVVSSERQAALDVLKKGLNGKGMESLTAGDRTGSTGLQYAEQFLGELPGSNNAAHKAAVEKYKEFTAALAGTAGIDADRLTQKTLRDNAGRIGKEMDGLVARTNAVIDPATVADAQRIADTYRLEVASPVKLIDHTVARLQNAGGVLPGESYQDLRTQLSRATSTADPVTKKYLRETIDLVDDAMERSIAAASPRDVGKWQKAREQYRNQIMLEEAIVGAGQGLSEGLLTPDRMRTIRAQNVSSYARGLNEIDEFVNAAAQ